MKEYEIYGPITYNDGLPIEDQKIERIGKRLLSFFDGMTVSPQKSDGYWKVGHVTYRHQILIFRVIDARVRLSRRFLRKLKEDLKRYFRQKEILIVEKDANVL